MEADAPRFWFDYVDPASFVMEARLREAEDTVGERVIRTGFELAPPPTPPLRGYEPGWVRRWEEAARAGREIGLKPTPPGAVPWTRKAHELAIHARDSERLFAVHAAIFRSYLLEGQDIGRIDVLVEIGSQAGLDRDETRTVLGVDRHLPEVRANAELAEREGVRGVPTLAIGERRLEGLAEVEAIIRLLSSR